MVRVPTYTPDVSERPALRQDLTVRATPDDFGAQVGRGLQSVARGGMQVAEAMQAVADMEDVAAAKEADNALADWSREAMYGDSGFMLLEGRAAVDARKDFEKQWEQKRLDFGKGLRAGASKRYMDASTARRQQVLQSTAVHTAQQRKAWFAESAAARLNTFAEDALAAYEDPARVNLMLAAGQAELRQQAELLGWDADTLKNKEAEYLSGVHKSIALRIAVDDPIAAKEYADGHADMLTGPHQYDLELTLDGAVKEETAKREASRIVESMNAGEPVDVAKELNAIEDEDVRILTENRINALVATETAANEAAIKAAKSQLWTIIEKGGTPDDVPFEVRQMAGLEAVSSAWGYVERRANRTDAKDDQALLYEMRLRAAADPVGFSQVDLNDYRDRLSPEAITELTGLQSEAIADKRKATQKGITYSSAFKLATDQLEAIGLTTTGKTGGDRDETAARIGMFQNSLATLLDEFFKANEREPTEAEVQDMVNRLLLPVVIKTPKNFWSLNPLDVFGGTDNRDGYLFEAGSRPDKATVEIAVKYEDIPLDLRRGISVDLERELGRKPSPEEVADVYEVFVLSRNR